MTETARQAMVRDRAQSKRDDPRNVEIIERRMAKLDAREGPRVGDYVRFTDGTLRRCSYHWSDGAGWDGGMQTSDGGSFYLGEGYVSMSGSLYSCVPTDSLKLTDETREGTVWIFDHDFAGAGRAVHYSVPFRVFTCELPAPN